MKDKKSTISTTLTEPTDDRLTEYQLKKMRATLARMPTEFNDAPSQYVPPVPNDSFEHATIDPTDATKYNGLTIEQMRDLGQLTQQMNDLDKTALALKQQLKHLPAIQRLKQAGDAIKAKYGQTERR